MFWFGRVSSNVGRNFGVGAEISRRIDWTTLRHGARSNECVDDSLILGWVALIVEGDFQTDLLSEFDMNAINLVIFRGHNHFSWRNEYATKYEQ